jgi:hypothetical protein
MYEHLLLLNSTTAVLAQLTVPAGSSGSAVMGVQGQGVGGVEATDWQHDGVSWSW